MIHQIQAKTLLLSAFDYGKEDIRYKEVYSEKKESSKEREFEEVSEAIPVELFPPCILKILEGIDDGKKRSLFVLTNFLTSVGWSYDEVEEALIEWNKKNKEPLKEQLIRGQVSYHKRRKEKVLPPNCRSYYQDFGMCFPDSLCDKIKNPVQYSKRKAFIMNKPKSRSVRLTEEQKEMRRKHRQKLKKEKEMKHR